jgi:DNA (cytosine-5)-methyltransferase 1
MNAKHLDLFSGIGGFHLAAEWAGLETIGFSEIDPYCCALLEQHWPEIPNYGDIRTADFSHLRGRITVLSAGVPCQPASLAGKRRGAGDDRWLWPATLDVVGCVQPAWCIFENPDGIASLHEFRGILLRLGSLGYSFRLFRVPANAVGAKHRRYRVFVAAHAECVNRHWRRSGWEEEAGGRSRLAAIGSGVNTETLADANGPERRQEKSERNEYNGQEAKWRQGPDRLEGVCDKDQPRGFRLTQPPLCGRADGVRDRSHRLRALGNAVVPQQAYPFFAAIVQTMKEFNLATAA